MKIPASKPETVFFVIGFIFGLLYIITTPPIQVADEDRHFYRAFQVAEGHWISEVHDNRTGGWMPRNIIKCGSSTTYLRKDHTKTQKIAWEDILYQFREPLNLNDRVFVPFRSSVYSPIAYAPSAFVIRIGIWCRCSPILLMYLGRTANLVCWLFLVWISIRIIPFFKWVFFVLALTPMSLNQAASLSADSVTNALAFSTIAYFLYLSYGVAGKISAGKYVVAFALTLALCLTKNIFSSFCFLFLLIPYTKTANRKQYFLLFLILVALNFLVCLMWFISIKHQPVVWGGNACPHEQISFILSSPLQYIKVLLSSIIRNLGYLLKGFIGAFGWSFFYLPQWHNRLWGLFAATIVLTDADKEIIIGKQAKLLFLSVAIVIGSLIYTLLYIYWNPVESHRISGVQARYFIPIAPLLLLCLYNRRFCFDSRLKPVVIGIGIILSLTISLFVIYHRFYVP